MCDENIKYQECTRCGKTKYKNRKHFVVENKQVTNLCKECSKSYHSIVDEGGNFTCITCQKSKKFNEENFVFYKRGLLRYKECRECIDGHYDQKCKICISCGENKSLSEYTVSSSKRKDGTSPLKSNCNECCAKRSLQSYHRNKNKKGIEDQVYRTKEEKDERRREYDREVYRKEQLAKGIIVPPYDPNKPKMTEEERKESIRKSQNKRNKKRKKNPSKRLHDRISASVRNSLKNGKEGKSWRTLVGYSLEDLQKHIESQFNNGMSWERFHEIEIDHIIPVESFNITSPEDEHFKKCWHLSNLQPLWTSDNVKKSDWIIYNGERIRARTLTKQQKHIYIASLNLPPYDVPNHNAAQINPLINQISLTLPIYTYQDEIKTIATNLPIRAPLTRRLNLI